MSNQETVGTEALSAIVSDIKTELGSKANASNVYTKNEVNELIQSTTVSDDIKRALLACFSHAVWADENGQDYIDNLEEALYPTEGLVSISCVYTQSGTVYPTTSLDDLRSDLVVTALYDDTHTEVVNNYALSGTLTEGTSTITVTYQRKTTTFNVVVSQEPRIMLYDWDFTQSLVDTVGGVSAELLNGATRDSSGAHLTSNGHAIKLFTSGFDFRGKTIEFDIGNFQFGGSKNYHIRVLMLPTGTYGCGALIWDKTNKGWSAYSFTATSGTSRSWGSIWDGMSGDSDANINSISGKNIKVKCDTNGKITLYVNNVNKGTQSGIYFDSRTNHLYIGGDGSTSGSDGNQCYTMTVTSLKIYEES